MCSIEARYIQAGQRIASIEHEIHSRDLRGVKAGHIQACQRIAAIEHTLHICHLCSIEARHIQAGQRIAGAEHVAHIRDVRSIQQIQSGDRCRRREIAECHAGIRICHDLPSAVAGNGEGGALHIGLDAAAVIHVCIPGLINRTGRRIAVLDLDGGNGILRRRPLIPATIRRQRRHRFTLHVTRLIRRRQIVRTLRHRDGNGRRTVALLRHRDLITVHRDRRDIGIAGIRRNSAVPGTSHGNSPGRAACINGHGSRTEAQRTSRLPDLPRDTHSICRTIRPAIAILQRERRSIGTRIGPGRCAANGHLRGIVTTPGRRLCIAVIRQSPALHRPPHFALKSSATATGASTGTGIRTRDRGIGNCTNASHSRQLCRRIVLGKALHIPITVRLGNVRRRRRRQIAVRTNELELRAQRYLLQLMTAIESGVHICYGGSIEGRQIQVLHRLTASEHAAHIRYLSGIERRQIRSLQLIAILEHRVQAGDIGCIEAGQFHSLKVTALIEHHAQRFDLSRIEIAQIQ